MPVKILVTGASGFIGRRFCAMARASRHEVVALMRPRASGGAEIRGRVVYGQLPYHIPAVAWEGVTAIMHCAGTTTGQDDAESEAINVEGMRRLIEQARGCDGFRRFVFLSSQSAHEEAVSAYGRTKLDAEKLLRDSGLPHAILRPGLVFGPGRQGLFYRMRQSVRKLPVLPLIGGGHAPVQPIDVGDLCVAMLKCLDLPDEESVELNLGEPKAMELRDFLQAIAVAESGRRKPQLVVPLGPIKLVVGIGEALRLPLPISSDNIRGMEMVRTMDTEKSLIKLNLDLQPFDQAMKKAVADEVAPAASVEGEPRFATDPVRLVLIGAGKVGIVHALNITQREGSALAAIVDPKPGAWKLYQSMGFRTEFRTDAAAALDEFKPDGAIIATPAGTHLPLARMCLQKGVAVLVEKPMAITPALAGEFEKLAAEFPGGICHVGYMAAQYPHLDVAREIIAGGEAGAVRGFHAYALQSHIMAPKPVRWEMVRAQSGGGAIINFAGHVLTMLLRLFGEPVRAEASLWPVHSTEVEDAAEVRFAYPGFEGRLAAGWSIPGYARPTNRIVVELERGRIVVENQCASFERDGKTERLWTQLDFDLGYNAAPDYTGAGFAAEHRNFASAIRARRAGEHIGVDQNDSFLTTAVTVAEAARAERFIFSLYEKAGQRARYDSPWVAESGASLGVELDDAMAMALGRLRA
ncbi:MAG: Gfo/Idh/MocA family oxidoreductase [Candidatus Sumerlaeaceae bacterium]|nr:Gfo/Idh/MocA family oxidoreductase [Candidatus Sumerlaeaceae bacterium]